LDLQKKATNPTTLKVKPLSDRRRLGGGKTEKIMGDLEGVKKMRIQVEQAANKRRMGFDEKRKPLKSDAKSDIKIAQDARKRRSKTRKEQAAAIAGGSAAIGAVAKLGESYEKKKKAKKTKGMEE